MEVEEEKNPSRERGQSEGGFGRMDLSTDQLLMERQIRLADRMTTDLSLLHLDQIDLVAFLVDEQTETPLQIQQREGRIDAGERERDEHSC